ncbi:MAG: prepilin-type N-terminal cleavage/methylation domain-containing protein [Nitrospiraceae bacterium]|nr:prepilin-type N-terminal cleavage/methylation domain-containing protein [Nitrospiraceae bacterium]
MRRNPGAEGFTLLEVLLATALTVIVLGAVYATFFLVERASRRGQQSLLVLYEAQKTMDLMRRELEASEGPMTIVDKEYFGKHGSTLTFSAFSPRDGVLSKIVYLAKEGDEKNRTITLEKQLQTPGRKPQEADLLENIDEFQVQAYSGGKWASTLEAGSPPDEMRITLKLVFKDKPIVLEETVTPRIGKQL